MQLSVIMTVAAAAFAFLGLFSWGGEPPRSLELISEQTTGGVDYSVAVAYKQRRLGEYHKNISVVLHQKRVGKYKSRYAKRRPRLKIPSHKKARPTSEYRKYASRLSDNKAQYNEVGNFTMVDQPTVTKVCRKNNQSKPIVPLAEVDSSDHRMGQASLVAEIGLIENRCKHHFKVLLCQFSLSHNLIIHKSSNNNSSNIGESKGQLSLMLIAHTEYVDKEELSMIDKEMECFSVVLMPDSSSRLMNVTRASYSRHSPQDLVLSIAQNLGLRMFRKVGILNPSLTT